MGSRLLLFVFCLMMPGMLLAQTAAVDTQRLIIKDASTVPTNWKPLVVVDNKVVSDAKKIDTAKVLNIALLNRDESTAIYGSAAANGAVIVTTKQFAINTYNQKLSAFSAQYKEYIERDKTQENWYRVSFIYIIDGKTFYDGNKNTITALYKLNKENLNSVFITSKFDASYSPSMEYKITIITKN